MDQKTIEAYDARAVEYDEETVDFWDRFPRTFLDQFIELSGERVLDVGSGPGRDGLLLQEAGKEVTCLDASEAMIKLSTERGLNSTLGDFTALPFADASFDGVWSYTAYLHVPKKDMSTALVEARRVLALRGILGLGLIEGDTEEYKNSLGSPRLFSYYQRGEVEALARAHNFEPVYFESFKPGSRNYLNFIFRKI